MKRAVRFSLIVTMILALLLITSLSMAGVRGKFKGKVVDSKGNPLAEVTLTIQSLRIAGEQYTIKTDENGTFSYVGLKPYLYKITVEKQGYQPYIEPEYKIRAGKWVTLDVTLLTEEEAREQQIEQMSPEQKAVVFYNQSLDAFNSGDVKSAIEKLNIALDNNPNLYKAQLRLGMIYFSKLNDKSKAKEAFEKAVAIDESQARPYEFLGAIAKDEGKIDDAINIWKQYFEMGGDSGIVAENLAVIYIERKDNVNARKYLEKGVELDPEYAPLYKKLGDVTMRSNDFKAAVDAYTKYLELAPQNAPDRALVTNLKNALEKAVAKQGKK